jgi:CubicO group peptidase (beta-lactamase class C family)
MANVTEIDRLLEKATSTGSVPGVVALAANQHGTFYQGAFGTRSLADGKPMTLDTVFWIASMTKAVTGVAAMQCVEQGKLSLDQPAGEILPQLAEPQVLEGFDAAGQPKLRPAKKPITLRLLLTHTAGFVYDTWNANQNRFADVTNLPAVRTGKLESLKAPLGFEPGERWEYGINIDWAGLMVEAVSGKNLNDYMREQIFAPLGMHDTGFVPSEGHIARLAQTHQRKADGSLEPLPLNIPGPRDFFPGGGGLFSTGPDYMRFLQMLLHSGAGNGARVLQPETVALMAQNHIGDLDVQMLKSYKPASSNDAEFFPGMKKKWGLTWFITTEDAPGGRRSAGSLAWAGLFNTYFWIDPQKQITGALLTQVLPFADRAVLDLLDDFEAAVYRAA